jgi:hypothetical protein
MIRRNVEMKNVITQREGVSLSKMFDKQTKKQKLPTGSAVYSQYSSKVLKGKTVIPQNYAVGGSETRVISADKVR